MHLWQWRVRVLDRQVLAFVIVRQEESEWIEYARVIDDVVNRSGLNKEIFYDLRGNHDSYGVPEVGGMFDFYKKHSINARLGRTGAVQSITLQVGSSQPKSN